jgi:hypothetical protein
MENWRNYEQEATTFESERLFFLSEMFLGSLFNKNLSKKQITEYTKNPKFNKFINHKFTAILPDILDQNTGKSLLSEALQTKISSCLNDFFLISETKPQIISEFEFVKNSVNRAISKIKGFFNPFEGLISDLEEMRSGKVDEKGWQNKVAEAKAIFEQGFKKFKWIQKLFMGSEMVVNFIVEKLLWILQQFVEVLLLGTVGGMAYGAYAGAVAFGWWVIPIFIALLSVSALFMDELLGVDVERPDQMITGIPTALYNMREKLKKWRQDKNNAGEDFHQILGADIQSFETYLKEIKEDFAERKTQEA